MKVLLTGGAGYIGSHCALELLAAGYEPVLLDNFSNTSAGALAALGTLAGRDLPFVAGDVRDGRALDGVFDRHRFGAVLHFAGAKAAGESVREPQHYYANNVAGTAVLLDRMAAHGVKTLVFSSSAAVYAGAATPLSEDAPTDPDTPYGRTKLMGETMLRDQHAADPQWRISILRYFNAAGAHPGGGLGDGLWGAATNLLPRIAEVALGRRACLEVYGDDHPTPDGTCVRDYLHVLDVARAHVLALGRLARPPGLSTHNLGAGRGHSVLEVVAAFERASGLAVPVRVVGRRPGEVAVSRADATRARAELGWCAWHDLDRICEDVWRAQSARSDCAESSA